jgi:hypothetical protein
VRKVILLIALSVGFIAASRWAAKYGIAWYTRRPPGPGLYWDMKTVRDEWLLIEVGLLGLGVVSFAAAAVTYFRRKRVK